jgi:hypothetical protein
VKAKAKTKAKEKKRKNKTQNQNQKGQKAGHPAIKPRTSRLPDNMVMVTRPLPHNYPTVTRRLPHDCQPTHSNTYTLIDKIYVNIIFHCDTFIQPYLCPNSNCTHAHEVKAKAKTKTKQSKAKQNKNKNKSKAKAKRETTDQTTKPKKQNKTRPPGHPTSEIEPTRQHIASILTW